ncbi:hypothetical protein EHS13_20065 [Paenibacillus psychroresistens]|uniref:Uncharacterized protein n=1 Tax=Paenibacillus psychroresistens TaxID=1778678 RepID=A0A6B8RN93_9BACL|nr:hypothetical protein [Paenibacillus psychroresistens]QGQ97015.1 hypothetical protein EHS13_20065 [Paenibacillus psychroresistens]
MYRPFLQIIHRSTLNFSPEAIAAHQAAKPLPLELESWLKIEVPLSITFDSPQCTHFSAGASLRRLAAKYGANHIQNVCEAQETTSQ